MQTDSEPVEQRVPGDRFFEEVTALVPALRAFGCSLCGDRARADDFVQDTVLKAWINRGKFQSDNLKAWLFAILRNCYFSELRHRRLEIEDPDGFYASQLTVSPDWDAELQVQDLSRALRRLPRAQREVLLSVHAIGLSYAEVANALGVAEGTIKSRIARARSQLVSWLGEDAAHVEGLALDVAPFVAQHERMPAERRAQLWYE